MVLLFGQKCTALPPATPFWGVILTPPSRPPPSFLPALLPASSRLAELLPLRKCSRGGVVEELLPARYERNCRWEEAPPGGMEDVTARLA